LFTASGSPGTVFVKAVSGSHSDVSTVTVVLGGGPVITAPASANPNPVNGSTTTLSVSANDPTDPQLNYTWSLLRNPPAPVTYSVNNSTAAFNTLATFSQAGTYQFQVAVTNDNNQRVTSSTNVVVNQIFTSASVSPSTASVQVNGQQQFVATGFDQFG